MNNRQRTAMADFHSRAAKAYREHGREDQAEQADQMRAKSGAGRTNPDKSQPRFFMMHKIAQRGAGHWMLFYDTLAMAVVQAEDGTMIKTQIHKRIDDAMTEAIAILQLLHDGEFDLHDRHEIVFLDEVLRAEAQRVVEEYCDAI